MDSGAEAGRVGSRYGAHLRSRPLADPAVPGIGGRLRRPRQPGAVHRCVRGWAGPHGGGFVGVEPKATGRPGYAPADLLKLYIYGYLNRVRSSRRLEAETCRNIEVIWLLRHLKPDFKTIADFRRDNRAAFKPVFRAFVLLCRRLDLFGRELLAVDGTRLKAVNNKDRNFTRASLAAFIERADAKLDDYLQRLDQSDGAEAGTTRARGKGLAEKIAAVRPRRARCQAMLERLEETGEDQISLTDPDSRAMAAHT